MPHLWHTLYGKEHDRSHTKWTVLITVMCHLMTGIHSEKCVLMQFCHCARIIVCMYTNLDSTAYSYSLLLLGYKLVQHVTVLNTVGNYNTMVSIIILHYNIMLRDHRHICSLSLTEMSLRGAWLYSRKQINQNTCIVSLIFDQPSFVYPIINCSLTFVSSVITPQATLSPMDHISYTWHLILPAQNSIFLFK